VRPFGRGQRQQSPPEPLPRSESVRGIQESFSWQSSIALGTSASSSRWAELLKRRVPRGLGAYVVLPALPLTRQGKIDLSALPHPGGGIPKARHRLRRSTVGDRNGGRRRLVKRARGGPYQPRRGLSSSSAETRSRPSSPRSSSGSSSTSICPLASFSPHPPCAHWLALRTKLNPKPPPKLRVLVSRSLPQAGQFSAPWLCTLGALSHQRQAGCHGDDHCSRPTRPAPRSLADQGAARRVGRNSKQCSRRSAVLSVTRVPTDYPMRPCGRQRMNTQRPLDPSTGCVFTAHLTSASDTEHLLTLRVHHIEADGWSIDVVEADLQELYAAAIVRCPRFPSRALPMYLNLVQQMDRAFFVNLDLRDMDPYRGALQYWKRQVADVRPTTVSLGDQPLSHLSTRQRGVDLAPGKIDAPLEGSRQSGAHCSRLWSRHSPACGLRTATTRTSAC